MSAYRRFVPRDPMKVDRLPSTVGIVGSRGPSYVRGRHTGWTDYRLVNAIIRKIKTTSPETMILTGDAVSGVDAMVRLACTAHGYHTTEHIDRDPLSVDCPGPHYAVFEAYWRGKDGKQPYQSTAGFARNDRLVRHCGLLIALFAPGARTPGTSDAVRRAQEYGIPVFTYHEGEWTE